MATEKMKTNRKAAEKVDTQNIGTTNKEDQVADLMNALEKANQKDLLLIRLKKIHRTVQKKIVKT